jgi:predicted transcriptional regulator
MKKVFTNAIKAESLARADIEGTQKVARDLGISDRTVRRWRRDLAIDDELRRAYEKIVDKRTDRLLGDQDEAIEYELSTGILKSLNFLQRCNEELDPGDPEAAGVAVKAVETMLEMLIVVRRVRERREAQGIGG